MRFAVLISCFFGLLGCSPISGKNASSDPQPSPAPGPYQTRQAPEPKPVTLGRQVDVQRTIEQPLIGLRYSRFPNEQFDFNFKVLPSDLGLAENNQMALVYVRLISQKTRQPITRWYMQRSLDQDMLNPARPLFFYVVLDSKSEAEVAIAELPLLAIQLAVNAIDEPESGQMHWIDLGGFCRTAPQNFIDWQSAETGCL